jgi:phage tail sheath gpL-like
MPTGRTVLEIVHPVDNINVNFRTRRSALGDFIDAARGAAQGAYGRPGTVATVGQGASRATGTLTLSTASGTVGGSINGVAVTVTASGGDTATATALAAAINASVNPLVQGIVTATSALGVVTLTATEWGKTGNAVTLAASGTGVTASGARLTGGAASTSTRTVTR